MKSLRNKKSGAALFTVLVILFSMSALIATMTTVSLNRVHMARKLADRVRALSYAEAGVAEACSILITNFYAYSNANVFPQTSYGQGWYDVSVIPGHEDHLIALLSTGMCNGTWAEAVVDATDYGIDSGPTRDPQSAWSKTIFANGNITANGSGDASGALHSNGEMTIAGGLDFSSPVDITSVNGVRITGPVTTSGHSIDAPTVDITGGTGDADIELRTPPVIELPDIDLGGFYNTAVDNGQVFPGGTYVGQSWSPPGGVIWIDGDLTIREGMHIDGILIVTGNIITIGNGDVSVNGGMIARDGSIDIMGNHNINGLLYSSRDITMGGSISMSGQILSGGDVDLNGDITLLNFVPPMPDIISPGVDNTALGIAAWQR